MDRLTAAEQDQPQRHRTASATNSVEWQLPKALQTELDACAESHGILPLVLLVSGWAALLYRWSSAERISLTCRTTVPESESLETGGATVVSTGVQADDGMTVTQLLAQVSADFAGWPCKPRHVLVELVDGASVLTEMTGRQRLTQESPALSIRISDATVPAAGPICVASNVIDRPALEELAAAWEVLLTGLLASGSLPVARLPILTAAARDRVTREFNLTEAPFPKERLIHELFEEQVRRSPNAPAVTFEGRSLTYVELNRKANRLARLLREKRVTAESFVGVCVERSLEMVVCLLAVLKAGGAYVPLDPAYPADRLAHMLRDSQPTVLLTERRNSRVEPGPATVVIEIDTLWGQISDYDDGNLERIASRLGSRQLAYVIYTSGSTGLPKGTLNEHLGMVNRITAQRQIEAFRHGDVCCQTTSISFVDAVFEIFGTLCNGLQLIIIPLATIRDIRALGALIAQTSITRLVTVPSLARAMLDNDSVMRCLTGLRSWTLSGEAVSAELLTALRDRLPDCDSIIQYGSSEVSSDAVIYKTRSFHEQRVPLGRPLPNVQIHILDRTGEPVPVGVTGEIHVGGVGVGRGYINEPELTAERFQRDQFSKDPQGRLYRTGDLGRWRADGLLDYLGRADHQVKVRGFRVEPGEIESQLLRQPGVREALVLAREEPAGEKRLVAYIVPRHLTASEFRSQTLLSVRDHLKTVLPDYMVPGAFVILEALPLTPNGKRDRRALPAPQPEDYVGRPYEAPRGEHEELLARIWQEILPMIHAVGRQDNFFELGGHSLLVVKLIERLHEFGLIVDPRRVFESETMAALADALMPQAVATVADATGSGLSTHAPASPTILSLADLDPEQKAWVAQSIPGGISNLRDLYPLGPLQEGILFHHRLTQGSPDPYILATLLSVESRQRVRDICAAFQHVIDRHDILRTAFLWEHLPHAVQVVCREATLPVTEVVLQGTQEAHVQIDEWARPENHSIDVGQAPLLRLQIARHPTSGQWLVLLLIHHLVQDAVSLRTVIDEVTACLEGSRPSAPTAPYSDYIAQVTSYAQTGRAAAFFSARLGDVEEPTAPFSLLESRSGAAEIAEATVPCATHLAQRIRTQARRLNVSAATVMHAAWSRVVAGTTGRRDVVFGTVLFGRLQAGAGGHGTVGVLSNMLPLRLTLSDQTVKQLIEKTQRELIDLMSHERASLALAQRCSGVSGELPLFTSVLNYRRSTTDFDSAWNRIEGVHMLAYHERTNYPITVSIDDVEHGFVLSAQTDQRLDPKRVLTYLQTGLDSLVRALEAGGESRADRLSILPERERTELIDGFSGTRVAYDAAEVVHALFAQQCQRTPNAIALQHDARCLTYAELDSKSNQLARFLVNEGVRPDDPVAICVPRGIEMVVGLLAIMKAGGAYVPLDPEYPAERRSFMLEDCAPKLLLAHAEPPNLSAATHVPVIALNRKLQEIADTAVNPIRSSEVRLTADNLVYVIYTSGSTGRPKGTAMPHRSMINLIEWHRGLFPSGQRVLQFAALSFDVAFQEIFTSLCTGSTVVLIDEWTRRDPAALLEYLQRFSIERLFIPPLMLQQLVESAAETRTQLPGLRDVICAGEQLRISPQITAFFAQHLNCRLHNHYGPTETHVVTAATLEGDPAQWPASPPIGKPIPNTRIYIVDEQFQQVPLGVAGELHVGGVAVARGYLSRPELTAQRFVTDLFNPEGGSKLYRTGDSARWRADGTLEYLGRNDDQVKVRGFRIEPGEIEALLRQHSAVKDCVVMVREVAPDDKRLIAYVTERGSVPVAVGSLRSHITRVLPEYMVPSAFVLLEQLPLSPNGKLDRGALPIPALDSFGNSDYEAPQGATEQLLADIWQQILRVGRVGRQDNFFALGGESLLGMKLITQIAQRTGVRLAVIAVFQHATVQEMSAAIDAARQDGNPPVSSRELQVEEGLI